MTLQPRNRRGNVPYNQGRPDTITSKQTVTGGAENQDVAASLGRDLGTWCASRPATLHIVPSVICADHEGGALTD